MKRTLIYILVLSIASLVFVANADNNDWRTKSTNQQKVEKLIQVMPGDSVIMLQMGERYKNLYWAAKQGKWQFAAFQLEEMEELIDQLKITSPARAATASKFMNAVFPALPDALATRDWQRFASAFDTLRSQCMNCHVKNDRSFVTLPIPKSANSPVLNME